MRILLSATRANVEFEQGHYKNRKLTVITKEIKVYASELMSYSVKCTNIISFKNLFENFPCTAKNCSLIMIGTIEQIPTKFSKLKINAVKMMKKEGKERKYCTVGSSGQL